MPGSVPRPLHDDHTFDEVTMRVASRRSDSEFSDGWRVGVLVEFRNKGVVVFSFRTNTLDAALARALWEYRTRLEQDAEAFEALEASTEGRCAQPGCAAKATTRLLRRRTTETQSRCVKPLSGSAELSPRNGAPMTRIDEIRYRLATVEYVHDEVCFTEDFLAHVEHDMEWLVAEHARLSAWVNARVKADLNEAAEKAARRRGGLWEPLVPLSAPPPVITTLRPLFGEQARRVVTPDNFTPAEQVIAAGLDALRPPEPEPREPFTLGDVRSLTVFLNEADGVRMGHIAGVHYRNEESGRAAKDEDKP